MPPLPKIGQPPKQVLWVDGHINAKVVAQSPQFIADFADFSIPEGTQFFIAHETGAGPEHPFSGEKMTVTMALYRAGDIDGGSHALRLAVINGFQLGKFIGMCFEKIRKAVHRPVAHDGRQARPAAIVKSRARGSNRAIHILV